MRILLFTVTPYQVGAQYSFKVNSGLISTTTAVNPGDNSFTFSEANGNALANNDIVTIDMIDSNGCTVNTSTESLTVTVNNPPTVTLTSQHLSDIIAKQGQYNLLQLRLMLFLHMNGLLMELHM